MNSPRADEIAKAIGGFDMGPGVPLRTILARGMVEYYEGDHVQAARCATWAINQIAKQLSLGESVSPTATKDKP